MSISELPTKQRSAALYKSRSFALALVALGSMTMGGCLALQVDNPNSLNLGSVFNNSANTEAALVGGWRRYTYSLQGIGTTNQAANCPIIPLGVYGNIIVTTAVATIEYGQEPKIPIDNTNTLNCASRGPYYDLYAVAASGREAYQGIIANNLTYGVIDAASPKGRDTPSRLAFARFLIAIAQLQLGLEYDQAFITDIATPPNSGTNKADLKPYKEVVANAISQFRGLIADLKAGPDFTTPATWINARPITRDELVRICYSYITRGEVHIGRDVAERTNAPWGAILARLDSGVTRDFGQQADPAIGATASNWYNTSYAQNTIRVSNRLVGPADTSGNYQAWIAAPISARAKFTITSPDRRIHGATNTTLGTRFTYLTTSMGTEALGTYSASKYRSNRYLSATADSGSKAFILYMSVDEQKFIRAEALFRLGRGAEAAALINPTRVAAGLKPVDANGPPAGRDCVPRKEDGTCGTLFDAIQYEKRIELYPYLTELAWADERGWGKLIRGTPTQLPISGRELQALGLTYYTFGGTGPGSAP